EQLQVRQRKGRRDDWALSAASRRRPTFLVEGRERQGGDQLSRRRDSPARCPWSGPIQGGAAARSAGRQDRRSIGGLASTNKITTLGDADRRFGGAGQPGD